MFFVTRSRPDPNAVGSTHDDSHSTLMMVMEISISVASHQMDMGGPSTRTDSTAAQTAR